MIANKKNVQATFFSYLRIEKLFFPNVCFNVQPLDRWDIFASLRVLNEYICINKCWCEKLESLWYTNDVDVCEDDDGDECVSYTRMDADGRKSVERLE